MEKFTLKDLKEFLETNIYHKKYRDLMEFLKKELGKDSNFDLIEYLEQNGTDVIFTARNKKELEQERKKYLDRKFKLMHYNIFKKIKSHLDDRKYFYK